MSNGKVTVTATLGEVVSTPIPYHSFRVGPFSITVECEYADEARKEYVEAKAFWFKEWKVGERG